MRSIVNAPDPNDAIQEHQIAQIDMTERELDFQRMRMEEMFPVPLDIDLRNEVGFMETNIIFYNLVISDQNA